MTTYCADDALDAVTFPVREIAGFEESAPGRDGEGSRHGEDRRVESEAGMRAFERKQESTARMSHEPNWPERAERLDGEKED